jgi:hypothetical protein
VASLSNRIGIGPGIVRQDCLDDYLFQASPFSWVLLTLPWRFRERVQQGEGTLDAPVDLAQPLGRRPGAGASKSR